MCSGEEEGKTRANSSSVRNYTSAREEEKNLTVTTHGKPVYCSEIKPRATRSKRSLWKNDT